MKNIWYLTTIGASVVVIFCAGIWVGKVTAPESLTPEEVRHYARMEAETGTAGKRPPKLESFQKYSRILGLDQNQRRELYPLFLETHRKLRILPQGTDERWEVIAQFHEDLKSPLKEEQKELVVEILSRMREREGR